jgi:hypothetical protein
MLPLLDYSDTKMCFESIGYNDVPKKLEPISEADEKNIIEMLAQELNSTFMTDLALEVSTVRDSGSGDAFGTEDALGGKRFIIVGASHASRLACALEDMGATVIDLSVPGWRAENDTVSQMMAELGAVLDEEYSGETFIVYHLYDNSCYLACGADGERSLPVKLADNKYHVPGRLVYIDRAGFRDLFTTTLPLLRAGRDHTKILLTPIMRYALAACCADPGHIINRREASYGTDLGEALNNIGDWLQDFAFTRRIRNFAVMCPTEVMRNAGEKIKGSVWTEGPVHMNGQGYKMLATAMLDRFADIKLSRKTEKKPEQSMKKMVDRAATRKAWVGGNDSAVQRRYEDEGSSRGHGTRGGGWPRGRGSRARGGGGRAWRERMYGGRGGNFKHFKPY